MKTNVVSDKKNAFIGGILTVIGSFISMLAIFPIPLSLASLFFAVKIISYSKMDDEKFITEIATISNMKIIILLCGGGFAGGLVLKSVRDSVVTKYPEFVPMVSKTNHPKTNKNNVGTKAMNFYKQYRIAKDGYIDKDSKLGMLMQAQNFKENVTHMYSNWDTRSKAGNGLVHDLDVWIQDIKSKLNGQAAIALGRNDNTLRESLLTLEKDFDDMWDHFLYPDEHNNSTEAYEVFLHNLSIVNQYCTGNLNYNSSVQTRELYSQISNLLDNIVDSINLLVANPDYLVDWSQYKNGFISLEQCSSLETN